MTMTASNNASTGSSSNDNDDSWSQTDLSKFQDNDEESSQQQQPQDDSILNSPAAEALLRVTLAGFAGALVGLSRQNQFSGTKIFQRSVGARSAGKLTGLSKAPPRLKTVQPSPEAPNIPLMWATSFMVFVSILETSRFWSPTTMALKVYQVGMMEEDAVKDSDSHDENVEKEAVHVDEFLPYQKYWTTLSDLTLGGAVAGLAGAMSKRQPLTSSTRQLELPAAILKTGRRPILLSGVGTGIALGLLAGVCQAGLEAAQDYVQELEEQEQQEQVEKEEQGEEQGEAKELLQTTQSQQQQQQQ